MALPAIVAGAAKALSAAGKGLKASRLAKGAKFLPKGKRTQEQEREAPGLLSTEGIAILPIAIILDITGMILLCVGLDDFFLTDIIGIIFIGGWLWLRTGKITETPKRKRGLFKMDFLRKLFRGKYKRFLTPFIGEVIFYLGAFPFWSLAVYFELTE
ncbi:hypothetical protein KAU40_01795 [Candidatus Parcubacteria bacterium]|nr:hypothetical protein [Candidatus Parcubacteria bacterium]